MNDQFIVNTGFEGLDVILGGFHSGGAYIIGGEEKCGKSSLILNFIENFVNQGNKVAYLSTELTTKDLDVYMGSLTDDPNWQFSNSDLFSFTDLVELDDLQKHLGVMEVEAASGKKIFILDNLTSYGFDNKLGKQEWERIAQAGDAFRMLARKLDVVLLMILHLNQGTAVNEIPAKLKTMIQSTEPDQIFSDSVSVYRRPGKDDLKGGSRFRSQTFGQIFLWRPYQKFNGYRLNKLCLVIVENNRYGATGDVRMEFNGVNKKFTETQDSFENAKKVFTPYKEDL